MKNKTNRIVTDETHVGEDTKEMKVSVYRDDDPSVEMKKTTMKMVGDD